VKTPSNLIAPLYAAVFAAEYERRYAADITDYFKDENGWPYNGTTGRDAWLEWCAALAHEHAEECVRAYERALQEGRIR
jgi:hypothetical protein